MNLIETISPHNLNKSSEQPTTNSQPSPSPNSNTLAACLPSQQNSDKNVFSSEEQDENASNNSKNKQDLDVESYSKTGFDWQAQRSTDPKISIQEREAYLPINCAEICGTRSNIDVSNFSCLPSAKLSATLSDVGGLDEQIIKLKQSLVLPLLYPEFCLKYSLTPSRGIMFHGPPGTGKTLLARALVNECSTESLPIAYFHFASSDILSKWVGESEARIGAIFEAAKLWQPSILFFDEIDGLAPIRIDEDRPSASFVSALLSKMDGIDDLGRVLVIGSTNRLESIDPALRRPGRFDEELLFPLPNAETRKDILNICLRNWFTPFSDDFVNYLAEITNGFNGADLTSLCYKAATNALFRMYPEALELDYDDKVVLESITPSESDFLQALGNIKPSTHRSSSFNLQPLKGPFSSLLKSSVNSALEYLTSDFSEQLSQLEAKVCVLEGKNQILAHDTLLTIIHSINDCCINFIDLSSVVTFNESTKINELSKQLETTLGSNQTELIVFHAIDSLVANYPDLVHLIRKVITYPILRNAKMFLFSCENIISLKPILDGVNGKLVTLDSVPEEFCYEFFNQIFHEHFDPRFSSNSIVNDDCEMIIDGKDYVKAFPMHRDKCIEELLSWSNGLNSDVILEFVNELERIELEPSYFALYNHLQTTFEVDVEDFNDNSDNLEYF